MRCRSKACIEHCHAARLVVGFSLDRVHHSGRSCLESKSQEVRRPCRQINPTICRYQSGRQYVRAVTSRCDWRLRRPISGSTISVIVASNAIVAGAVTNLSPWMPFGQGRAMTSREDLLARAVQCERLKNGEADNVRKIVFGRIRVNARL
jgi:hypothetical protein